MKTAISIPDELFRAGEKAAERLGMSRSELYRRALREFLAQHEQAAITEALDAVYTTEESSTLDPVLGQLQAASLEPKDW